MSSIGYQKRLSKDRKGNPVTRWMFHIYNPKKKRNDRLLMSQIPKHIRESQDEAEVKAWVSAQNLKEKSLKHHIEVRQRWKDKYFNFKKLFDEFEAHHKRNAKNSYQTDMTNLENHVFPYFLETRGSNDVYEWQAMFSDFRDHLASAKPLYATKKSLSPYTQNNIIRSLNAFMAFLFEKNYVKDRPHKMKGMKQGDLPTLSKDDVFMQNEINNYYKALMEVRPDSAEIFLILVSTGMRFNELLGLPAAWLRLGKIEGSASDKIHKKLKSCGLDHYYGYIILKSQPSERSKLRDDDGAIDRKPLKTRKTMDPKSWRYIPLWEKNLRPIIKKRTEQAKKDMRSKKYGANEEDYLLFNGITNQMFNDDLRQASEALKKSHRSAHACRHTFCTWFYTETDSDRFLANKVTGHNSDAMMARYDHLAELIGDEQKQKKALDQDW